MPVLFIHVKRLCDESALSEPCNRQVDGIYAVDVDDVLNINKAASSALDTFHAKIAIGMLDDFEITVHEGLHKVDEDPDHRGYSLTGSGDVWFVGPLTLAERIFSGVYPCGIVYADRQNEKSGDYKRLAFLSYSTLELDLEADCPFELQLIIVNDAKRIQSMKGQPFEISTCGQTVTLGSALEGI
jgi:hypothetical protein